MRFISCIKPLMPIEQHLKSSKHQPRNIQCPGCPRKFLSHPDLVGHFESGTCSSGVNQDAVHRVVRSYDRTNLITNPGRMIENGGGTTTYQATEAAWNRRVQCYECYLCHKYFSELDSLNRHLASAAHEERIYMCPLNTCRATFARFSSLWKHIESEKCGVKRFRQVQETIDGITNRFKAIGL